MSARDVLKQFDVQLLQQLPLDNELFFATAYSADLFPPGTVDLIAAEPTRAKKVSYFLQHVVLPEAEVYVPKLLKVMKKCKFDNVVRLADDIQAAMGIGMYVQLYIYL